jgi:hypothetical protein
MNEAISSAGEICEGDPRVPIPLNTGILNFDILISGWSTHSEQNPVKTGGIR